MPSQATVSYATPQMKAIVMCQSSRHCFKNTSTLCNTVSASVVGPQKSTICCNINTAVIQQAHLQWTSLLILNLTNSDDWSWTSNETFALVYPYCRLVWHLSSKHGVSIFAVVACFTACLNEDLWWWWPAYAAAADDPAPPPVWLLGATTALVGVDVWVGVGGWWW